MSTITKPIRELLKSDVEFHWGDQQKEALQQIEEIMTEVPVLVYYDVSKPVAITCYASKAGMGAVLLKDKMPVAYASNALTDAETRYAQTEKELLAVVFALERFNQYTYARTAEVETDLKPLLSTVKETLAVAPPRLQRMSLRLQCYEFTLKYTPGKEVVLADTLSRVYLAEENADDSHMGRGVGMLRARGN